jgi:hypothetical protein
MLPYVFGHAKFKSDVKIAIKSHFQKLVFLPILCQSNDLADDDNKIDACISPEPRLKKELVCQKKPEY